LKTSISFIVVFHNSEKYVEKVLKNVIKCMSHEDALIVIADGCTDSTTLICKKLLLKAGIDYKLEETNDLHEIGALNVAFGFIKNQDFIMHIQGDMVIDSSTFHLVRQIIRSEPRLGVLSFRMGGCFVENGVTPQLEMNEMNFGHNFTGKTRRKLKITLYEFCVAGRGPILFNHKILVSSGGTIDQNLRPHSIDDIDLSLLAMKFGYKNFAVNLPYRSDVTWGASRSANRSVKEPVNLSAEKNLKYIAYKHSKILAKISIGHTHRNHAVGNVLIQPYFMFGIFINDRLRQNNGKIFSRAQRKLAFLLSKRTV
jgi:glycosyltransferase involved in cell wall biosynthesis